MTNILNDLILGLVAVCCNFDLLVFRESDSECDGYCLEFLGLETVGIKTELQVY